METTTTETTYRAVVFYASKYSGKAYFQSRATAAEAWVDADNAATSGHWNDADSFRVESTTVVTTHRFVER